MKLKSRKSLSIFFPCYNDAGTIGDLIEKSILIARKLTTDFEVIVVDDGSWDESVKIILKKVKKYPKTVKLIIHKKNKGYGGALKTGFLKSTKSLIFYTDGDAQYDVSELPLLWNLMSDDVNFVNGIKMERQDYAYRVIIGNLYAFVNRWIFLLPIYDVDCDFRLIRRDLIGKIKNKLKSNSGSICVELVKMAQLNGGIFRQVSVHHLPRIYGQSQFFKPKRLIATFWELGVLWLRMMIFRK